MTTVGTIRDLNNRYPHLVDKHRLVCPNECGSFTGDLSRYWLPRDAEQFLCPVCDSQDGLWLQFAPDPTTALPLAQRNYRRGIVPA